MNVVDAYELDGQLHVLVDDGKGSTHAIDIPAGANRQAIRAACMQRIKEEEDRERRKAHRKDLLGDL